MFQEGQLVKWYLTHHDVDIVKDSGLGVIIEIEEKEALGIKWLLYTVHRIKCGDNKDFYEDNLELIKE